jgi:hypothetical protein
VAFTHHLNLGAVRRSLRDKLKRRIFGIPRASTMSAGKMRAFPSQLRMSCLQQELIPWCRSIA